MLIVLPGKFLRKGDGGIAFETTAHTLLTTARAGAFLVANPSRVLSSQNHIFVGSRGRLVRFLIFLGKRASSKRHGQVYLMGCKGALRSAHKQNQTPRTYIMSFTLLGCVGW